MIKLQLNNFSGKIDEVDAKILEPILNKIEKGEYGFVNLLDQLAPVQQSTKLAKEISKWVNTLVVVGIGGSDLGGRALQQALDNFDSDVEVIFVGDTTDPIEIDALLNEIDIESTIFNIISKSGTTTEIMAHYLYFKKLVKQDFPRNWQKHFIFTTSSHAGLLHKEGQEHGVISLTIPKDVGGRFSVLTPVGLFPAAAMQLDLEKLMQGAKDALSEFKEKEAESISYKIAAYQFAHQQDPKKPLDVAVMIPYSVRLNEFARWFRQLWAESLGKDGKGIMPIQAFGPADQHSQLQYYAQGKELATYIFLKVLDHQSTHKITGVEIPELMYMEGKDFQDLINIECDATQTSLSNSGRPNFTLEVEKVDEYALGQLFLIFELAVVTLAELLGVDAFDQPGVEDSKNEMYKRLGRAGY